MKKILTGSFVALLLVVLLGACSVGSGGGGGGAGDGVVIPAGAGTGNGFPGGRGPAPVNLGTAGNFAILAQSEITTTGTTAITGDIGISPAAETYISGFALTDYPTPVPGYALSSLVTGKVYSPDFAPAKMTAAIGDMGTAYTTAAGVSNPDHTELFAGDISGSTLGAGLYKWGTGVLINKDVTLSGNANDVWIFQIAKGITLANGTKVVLAGGALAKNVFWQNFGVVTIGTTAHMEGVVLSQTAITANTGSSTNGRLLAQTAVTLDASTVVQP
jgi:hypothetical protein